MGRGSCCMHCLPIRTILPLEALPGLHTPVSGREDALSSGQHRTCHFWNKAARLPHSDMPSASWPAPMAAPKHAANGSGNGATKGIKIFCFSLEIGFPGAIYFQPPYGIRIITVRCVVWCIIRIKSKCDKLSRFLFYRRLSRCPQTVESPKRETVVVSSLRHHLYILQLLAVSFSGALKTSGPPVFTANM